MKLSFHTCGLEWYSLEEAVFRTLAGFVEIVAYPWFPPDYHRTAYAWARDLAAGTGL